RRQIAWHIADFHRAHARAVLHKRELYAPGRHIRDHAPRRPGFDQAVLDAERDETDGAVPAHGQTAARLNEQNADISIWTRGRIEEAAGHHVVSTRLEAKPSADPIVTREEILALCAHGRAI